MAFSLKILWVHDDFEGPMNGIALYNNEKVWFSRLEAPFMVSSTETPLPQPLNRMYKLIRLDEKTLQKVEDDHLAYCKETDAPVYHGDPYKIRRTTPMNKMDFSKLPPLEKPEEGYNCNNRSMLGMKKFDHSYNPLDITGEFLLAVKESAFSNYLVPHRLVM